MLDYKTFVHAGINACCALAPGSPKQLGALPGGCREMTAGH